jgi:hypothetical protein
MAKIYLEPEKHVYINEDTGEIYKSVTTVLSMLEEEFPAQNIAQAIARQSEKKKKEKYKGLSENEILDLWEEENKSANEYGTKVHNLLEEYLKRNKFYFPENDDEREILNSYDDLNIDLGERFHCERILFSEEYSIAGMSDHIVDVDGGLFDINDYKTNKVINFYSQYKKKLLPPMEHLDDCQYNIYSLQLSIYAYFYEQESKRKCRSLNLLYFDRNSKKFIKYPVPYMKMEAIGILNHYRDMSNVSPSDIPF